ncbi:unnamed protein product [Rotaria sp. Silwood2]|nr:unnamed protein product [Rotaria sp. Silwood2]
MVQCTSCQFIEENDARPICESLRNRASPDGNPSEIDEKDLPRCTKRRSLVRSHIVWFGEHIWDDALEKIQKEIQLCDLFIVVCFSYFNLS